MTDLHVTEEELEEYLLGRLREAEADWMDLHLLVCDTCALQAVATEASMDRIRAILRHSQATLN